MNIKFKKLDPDASAPVAPRHGDAGIDIRALSVSYDAESHCCKVRTGIAVEIPEGYVGLMFMRSSNVRRGYVLKNAVGVIDSSYRGELTAYFMHTPGGSLNTLPAHGERIVQLVIIPYAMVTAMEQVGQLSPSERGVGGYGSTGT